MTEPAPELRPAYRTLNEPARLLGLSLSGWAAVLVAGAVGYGWLSLSPLPWRANVSLGAIALGLPIALIVLREQSTITPGRLLLAVLLWRARPPRVLPTTPGRPVRRGAVRLDSLAPERAARTDTVELPWVDSGEEALP